MRALIDSHILLWWTGDELRKSSRAYPVLSDSRNDIFVSTASIWELCIKAALGKLRVVADWRDELRKNNMAALPITLRHAQTAGALPHHHRDPFDRMLIAQAQIEDLTLITNDGRLESYDVRVLMA